MAAVTQPPDVALPFSAPYPEVNSVLAALHSELHRLLGETVAGTYLSDSLALGDFDESSDIDAVVVTRDDLSMRIVAALAEMHERLARYPRWGRELEVSYVRSAALRRYDPARDVHPYIGRGERLQLETHGREWDTHRHVLREHGRSRHPRRRERA